MGLPGEALDNKESRGEYVDSGIEEDLRNLVACSLKTGMAEPGGLHRKTAIETRAKHVVSNL